MKLRWLCIVPAALLTLGLVAPELHAQPKADGKVAKKGAKVEKVKLETMDLKLSNLTGKTKPKELKALTKALKQVEGVVKVMPQKKKGTLQIKHKPGADTDAIRAAVTEAGFAIIEPKAAEDDEAAEDGADSE